MEDFNSLPRASFEEVFDLAKLGSVPRGVSLASEAAKSHHFISRTPSWVPGRRLPVEALSQAIQPPKAKRHVARGAFGAHVYVQSALAAARVLEAEDDGASHKNGRRYISAIQGTFILPGLADRPYVYTVSEIASTRSFATTITTARQPTKASSRVEGPFPVSDAALPLQDACFTCCTSFKRSATVSDAHQTAMSPFERYRHILATRQPDQWPQAPHVDIDVFKALFPQAGHGDFPILDMHKVDMDEHNAGREIADRRELIFYRLRHPLPREDVNAHILSHVYQSDRNGLTMLANFAGYGFEPGPIATLNWSFFVHVNGEDMVMGSPEEADGSTGGWWLQVMHYPTLKAGKGFMAVEIWSPDGKHVASACQDGIVLPSRKRTKRQQQPGKL